METENKTRTINRADLILRVGVAFVFLYPAIAGMINPTEWIGYFPKFMRGIIPDSFLLGGFEGVEVVIALWILSGKKIFWPSVVATLMLVSIVVFNGSNFEELFRDIGLAAATLSLALRHKDSTS